MNKYLAEILKEVNTLIIPNFGALTVTNSSTGEVMFMPYLKYDDGKLVKFIAEKEGISEEESKAKIANYVGEIEGKLNSGATYELEPFGIFSKDSSGDIEFVSKSSDEVDVIESVSEISDEPTIIPIVADELPSPKVEEIKVEEIKVETVTPLIQEETESHEDSNEIVLEETALNEYVEEEELVEETVVANSEELEQEEQAIIEESKAKSKDKTATVILVETSINENLEEADQTVEKEQLLADESNYSKEQQWKDDLDLPPLNTKIEHPKKAILEKTQKDKKRRRPAFYILLVLAVLLLGGTLTIAMFYNSFEKMLPFLSKHPTEEVTPEKEELETSRQARGPKEEKGKTEVIEEEIIEETVEVPVEEPVPQKQATPSGSNIIQTSTGQVDRNKPFHIIGGAFSDKSNADRYQSKLISSGNTSVIIGKFDQLYIVSISSYGTKAEAENALTTSKSVSPNAWIFQWP